MDDETRLHTMDKNAQEKVNKSRERTDRISQLMGQYMLKGYRMLGSACDVCGNVLLKYRDQDDYCVACKEVDVDTQSAAKQGIHCMDVSSQVQQNPQLPIHETRNPFDLPSVERSVESSAEQAVMSQDDVTSAAVCAINKKIVWATEALSRCYSTGECIQLCELLKTCAETRKALLDLK